ncbi:abortive infection family protein [Deinococcus sp. RIT780]|uniref:abortive infection family protein n=1 Tax=Deinococcus sp. RIT780 TaxID=2870472 RepID=UPI001C89D831|nr:abortive infection family protein [Deinococcus sp. RIT780]MBX8463681.1 abortive infection family protein [Deinococcus sp. RIT780]
MGDGYVLNFTNSTFEAFLNDHGVAIYGGLYSDNGGSKANHMRSFLDKGADWTVGSVLADLITYGESEGCLGGDEALKAMCRQIAERLQTVAPQADLDALIAAADGTTDDLLLRHIREALQKDEPQGVVDRLHTFMVAHVRRLCQKHGIGIHNPKGDTKPLHSLFGEYVRWLRSSGHIESEMAERILRTSISVLDAFNDVRNSQSLAHDNPVLGHEEATLIVNHVSNLVRFVNAIEMRLEPPQPEPSTLDDWPPEDEDLPF